MVVSFANSEGWKLMIPRSIKLLTPEAVPDPVPINRVVKRRIRLNPYNGKATYSNQRTLIRLTTVNTTMEITNQLDCLIQASSVTGLGILRTPAEYIIAMPKIVISIADITSIESPAQIAKSLRSTLKT